MAESFFSSLKKERIRKRIYKTRDLARADIFDYIEVFYNRVRRHSHLGGVSPGFLLKAISRAQPQKNMRYIPQAFVADEPVLARHSTAHFHKSVPT